MRHGKKFNHLSRKKAHRIAMLSNMACSLIQHKRINTTVAKAKALKQFVEPLVNRSKLDNTHSRRMVFRSLRSKYAVNELFREVAPKVADRPGGYTRIIRTGFRLGDAAEMCMIELVDFNDLYTKEDKKKTRRSRRGGAKKKTTSEGDKPSEASAKSGEEAGGAATAKTEAKSKAEPKAEKPAEETKSEKPAEEIKAEEKKETPKPEAKAAPKEDKAEDKGGEEEKKAESKEASTKSDASKKEDKKDDEADDKKKDDKKGE